MQVADLEQASQTDPLTAVLFLAGEHCLMMAYAIRKMAGIDKTNLVTKSLK